MMLRNVVLLPAPLRPSRHTTSPAVDIEGHTVYHRARAVSCHEVAHGEHHADASSPR